MSIFAGTTGMEAPHRLEGLVDLLLPVPLALEAHDPLEDAHLLRRVPLSRLLGLHAYAYVAVETPPWHAPRKATEPAHSARPQLLHT